MQYVSIKGVTKITMIILASDHILFFLIVKNICGVVAEWSEKLWMDA